MVHAEVGAVGVAVADAVGGGAVAKVDPARGAAPAVAAEVGVFHAQAVERSGAVVAEFHPTGGAAPCEAYAGDKGGLLRAERSSRSEQDKDDAFHIREV